MTPSADPETTALVAALRAAGCVYAEEEAALLLSAAPDPDQRAVLLARRTSGEPLELVLGWADLAGTRVVVAPGVFVPRTRSGLLVRLAVAALPPDGVLVDLGCGTGALAAAVLARRPDAQVWAVDVDPDAVTCARRNLPADRVLEGDLWEPLPGSLRDGVHVVLANAPYVPTGEVALMPPEARDHEHRVALDGGVDGLEVQRRVARGAMAWLAPGGVLVVETSRRQAPATRDLLHRAGLLAGVETDDDLDATAATGRRPAGRSDPSGDAVAPNQD